MTEEEKKAIERCNELIKVEHANWIGISNQVAIETVLNLVKKQQEEIEFKNDIIKHKDKVYKITKRSLKGRIAKKDKIIDLIAETLGKKYCFTPIQEKCNQGADDFDRSKCIPCIKQYFENKNEYIRDSVSNINNLFWSINNIVGCWIDENINKNI